MPARVAAPPLWTNTGEPLSPGAERAPARSWQIIVTIEPATLVSMQVFMTDPMVPPVVRPTLKTTEPDETLPNRKFTTGRRGMTRLVWRVPELTPQKRGLAIFAPAEKLAVLLGL